MTTDTALALLVLPQTHHKGQDNHTEQSYDSP